MYVADLSHTDEDRWISNEQNRARVLLLSYDTKFIKSTTSIYQYQYCSHFVKYLCDLKLCLGTSVLLFRLTTDTFYISLFVVLFALLLFFFLFYFPALRKDFFPYILFYVYLLMIIKYVFFYSVFTFACSQSELFSVITFKM